MFEDCVKQIFRLAVLYLNAVNLEGYWPFFGLPVQDISILGMHTLKPSRFSSLYFEVLSNEVSNSKGYFVA